MILKKQFYLMAAATMLLASSCSNDEVTEVNPGNAISFRTAMATRGVETTANDLETVNVWGFWKDAPYFGDLTFTKGTNNTYTSNPVYYWPELSETAKFKLFSYFPIMATGATVDKDGLSLTDFAPAAKINEQKDVVYARAEVSSKPTSGAAVDFQFAHILSQIEFKALSNNETYDIKVKGIRIAFPKSKGNYATNTWTPGEDKLIYQIKLEEAILLNGEAKSLMGSEGNAMLIPQQLVPWDRGEKNADGTYKNGDNTDKDAYLSVMIQVTVNGSNAQYYPAAEGKYGWAAVPVSTLWEAGKKYIYVLDFTNGAGQQDPVHKGDPENPGDDDDEDEDPDPGKEDGEDIFGGKILLNVQVTPWGEGTQVPLPESTK